MLMLFLFFSIVMCVFFYYNLDPMKCSFFLVLSLLFISPVMSFGVHVWYSYFVCMIFLSGVFVILVYFSSLSSFSYMKKPFWFVLLCCCFLVGDLFLGVSGDFIGINGFYYDFFCFVIFLVIFGLVFFFEFCSYFLSVGMAVRKM
uniref:NADH dehydrogenase subunit 6 n=1 Tax=Passalurus ambiguus TaxID=451380 RepID=A0A0N7IQP0_PASAG|nr:NADH dehydrogenase subunit 6 [Passalurus ambiguus]ALJ93252.1 NADH dehydrogenase subunit 6 [Passalurus ambiguus]